MLYSGRFYQLCRSYIFILAIKFLIVFLYYHFIAIIIILFTTVLKRVTVALQ